MSIDQDLLRAAVENPEGITFEDACKLARQMGWIEERTKGSHVIFRHPKAYLIRTAYPRPLNLQRGNSGKAKAYPVLQMLEMAREMGIID